MRRVDVWEMVANVAIHCGQQFYYDDGVTPRPRMGGYAITTQRDPRGASVKLWADKEDGRMLGCF